MHLLALLDPLFTDRNDRSPYPFIYFNKWNPYPFISLTWSLRKVPISGGASPYRPLQGVPPLGIKSQQVLTCNGSLVSEANRERVHRSARDFFFFSFFLFCSLTVATFFMLFPLTTEPDPKLHRPFHSGTFLSSQVKQVVFLEKYSGWTCCIAFQNRTYTEIRAWLLKVPASNCHLSTL